MRVVAALGGNALVGAPASGERVLDEEVVVAAARALARVAADHELVVTHGNGPQVGALAVAAEAVGAAPRALDLLDAETEGMIGYVLARELRNALPGRECVGVLTQVVVDGHDPAFAHPTKPIGPWYASDVAARLEAERGWRFTAGGAGTDGLRRRVVASPPPREILELASIRALVAAGTLVVCAGGGGIPVARGDDDTYVGVDAVIDKDRASALLAHALGADALLLLTDVDGVSEHWRTPDARLLHTATPEELDALGLDEGSMRPKAEAAVGFLRDGGTLAAIGPLLDAAAMLRGDAGTRVVLRRAGPRR